MSLDKRSAAILHKIMQADSYVTVQELLESQGISKRTLYYDMNKINDWLKENQLPDVQYIRSTGYYIDEQTKQKIPDKLQGMKKWQYEYSVKERKAWLTIYLLTQEGRILLEDLMNRLGVSRNTTLDDLKKLKTELQAFHISLHFDRKQGYFIQGEEQDKRKALIFYLSQAVTTQSWNQLVSHIQTVAHSTSMVEEEQQEDFLKTKEIQVIREALSVCERLLGIQYTDEVLESLSIHIHLFRKRFSRGQHVTIDMEEKEVLKKTKHFEAATYISNELSKTLHIDIPEDETYYIATHLLGARVMNQYHSDQENSHTQMLLEAVQRMITDFQKFACIMFENPEGLKRDLILHLKPAFYRIKYGINMDNPLIDSIKTHYHEIFLLTQKVIVHFEQLVGQKVCEDEIAYISMHFGAWLRKQGANPAPRKKALIVCPNGIGTSLILQNQLENLFSSIDICKTVSLREYEARSYDVDLIFSTTTLTKSDAPVYVVNPILNDAEKARLLRRVGAYISDKEKQPTESLEGMMSIIRRHAVIKNEEALHQELKEYLLEPAALHKELTYKPTVADILTRDQIQVARTVANWEEAIRLASAPLVRNGSILPSYVDAMIRSVYDHGPYIVIAPKIAIPHSRPQDGVQRLSMSLLQLKHPVSFSERPEHSAQLFIVLAAIDNETHLRALAQLTAVLSSPEALQTLLQTDQIDDVLHLLEIYSQHQLPAGL
ncbi:BglG family transcription antiterminator [Brevibacillus laterosporus]|uniref:BglG family transcription antiterminator n=1 Tax=Brevibacillus laterosporus TaxID=1465 RepID=UPI0026551C86|nr:BglG family transcription antiterminator [Brevibacillus laterosporus]MDN9011375.1 BglG family transcription antiterminator [Brevibacillus laterosporus]MDO0942447.1 BglG family transcription antiterminator [Brevibacillus laterosporus]